MFSTYSSTHLKLRTLLNLIFCCGLLLSGSAMCPWRWWNYCPLSNSVGWWHPSCRCADPEFSCSKVVNCSFLIWTCQVLVYTEFSILLPFLTLKICILPIWELKMWGWFHSFARSLARSLALSVDRSLLRFMSNILDIHWTLQCITLGIYSLKPRSLLFH